MPSFGIAIFSTVFPSTSVAHSFNQNLFTTCQVLGFHIGVVEDSSLLGCSSVDIAWCPRRLESDVGSLLCSYSKEFDHVVLVSLWYTHMR